MFDYSSGHWRHHSIGCWLPQEGSLSPWACTQNPIWNVHKNLKRFPFCQMISFLGNCRSMVQRSWFIAVPWKNIVTISPFIQYIHDRWSHSDELLYKQLDNDVFDCFSPKSIWNYYICTSRDMPFYTSYPYHNTFFWLWSGRTVNLNVASSSSVIIAFFSFFMMLMTWAQFCAWFYLTYIIVSCLKENIHSWINNGYFL